MYATPHAIDPMSIRITNPVLLTGLRFESHHRYVLCVFNTHLNKNICPLLSPPLRVLSRL
jgi:hypothetical protein